MKPYLIACLLSFCAVVATMAQQPSGLDSLATAVSQHNSVLEQIAGQQKAAVASPAKAYLSALDSLAAVAAKSGSTGVASAIEHEQSAVQNGEELPSQASAELPAQLFPARRSYLAAAKSAVQALAPRVAAENDRFSRTLDSLEASARSRGDQAQLGQIAEEKRKLAPGAQSAADVGPKFRKNLARNGDFANRSADPGIPAEWTGEAGAAAIALDGAKPYVHLTGDKLEQIIVLPAGTQSVQVQCRLRGAELKAVKLPGQHQAGVRIHFEDASGHHIRHEFIGLLTAPQRAWKHFSETKNLPPGAARIRLILFREGMDGTIDADDFSVEALGR